MAADPAVNYSAIGYVVGHEIGHAFDEGSRLRSLASSGLVERRGYQALRAGRREARSSSTTPSARCRTMSIKGKLTLGENIADLTSITIAYRAYREASLGGKEAPVIDGARRRPAPPPSASRRPAAPACARKCCARCWSAIRTPGALSRARGVAQLHALLRRLRREGRRRHVPAARQTREDLVD
ncbi:MAG: hypothetical protein IPO20_22695 [Gammaproteobacteria bacterium]|nr:hypothetical protein [Gammaproteobacteria bacterium]